jgi:hypothetical protein
MRSFFVMQSSKIFLLILMLFIVISSGLGASILPSVRAAGPPASGYNLTNTVNFNQFGQLYVNETISELSNASSGLSAVTLGFPSNYTGHIVNPIAQTLVGGSITNATVNEGTGANGSATITISPSSPLSPGKAGRLSLTFYVVRVYKTDLTNSSGSYLLAPVVFSPSINTKVDSISSHLTTPLSGVTVANTTVDGFSHTTTSSLQSWDKTTSINTTTSALSKGNLLMDFSGSDVGVLDFRNLTRAITVNPQGQVTVLDSAKIQNLGPTSITSLPYNVLGASQVTMLPPTQPPLSNLQTASVTNGEIDLSAVGGIQPNSNVSLEFEYPLNSSYWSLSNGVYHVSVPANLPVNALVDYYNFKTELPSGYYLSQAPIMITATNVSNLTATVNVSYRQGIASAFAYALPIALLVFIAALIAALVFRPKAAAQIEELESSIDELVKVVEEKVSGTNDILADLRAAGLAVARNQLASARTRIDELRTKTGSRFASLRAEILETSPEAQGNLAQVSAADREFDRSVRDLLGNYEQFIAKRMKGDTFDRVRANGERRIQSAANNLLDAVRSVRRTSEA